MNHRKITLQDKARLVGLENLTEDSDSCYLARAVSSVPVSEREHLEQVYNSIIASCRQASLEPLLPVELDTNTDPNDINPLNHQLLLRSKIVLPLAYAISDGRGWEIGFSYGAKLIVPLVLPDQKINTPTLRLPYLIPILLEDVDNLPQLLKELASFDDYSFGALNGTKTVIGHTGNKLSDLRKVAQKYLPVVDYRI